MYIKRKMRLIFIPQNERNERNEEKSQRTIIKRDVNYLLIRLLSGQNAPINFFLHHTGSSVYMYKALRSRYNKLRKAKAVGVRRVESGAMCDLQQFKNEMPSR